MEIIALLFIVYFLIGACICLLICVNPNDPGFLGSLNRFCFKKVPTVFSNFIRKFFGQGVLNCLGGVKHYVMQTNHPIVQIFYLMISPGGFTCYVIYGIFKHMPNQYVSLGQALFAMGLAVVCFWVYYKACATSPGEVTKANAKQYISKYKEYYDGQIYKQKNQCKTCKLDKPARSKHCSICRMCVSKYDHHCVWVRQCVGEKNYKYFVSFLFLHSVWCLFLSYIGARSLMATIQRMNFMGMKFNMNGQIVQGDFWLALQYLFMSETIFFFLIVMCAIMGFTLLLFVIYHFYLIGNGTTTNERVKKNDDIDFYTKELKYCKGIRKQFVEGVTEVDVKDEKITQEDLDKYEEGIRRKKAIAEKIVNSDKGIVFRFKEVFSQ